MECPKCKLVNPGSAVRCDCGYDFVAREVRASRSAAPGGLEDVRSIVGGYKANNILGERAGALLVDIFVFIIALVALSMTLKGEGNRSLILWAVFIPLYFIVLEGRWGVTLGKLAAKLRVVTADGAAPGYGRATVRMLLRVVEVNPVLLGAIPAGIVVLLSEHRQRLGDMLAGTYVIHTADLARVARR